MVVTRQQLQNGKDIELATLRVELKCKNILENDLRKQIKTLRQSVKLLNRRKVVSRENLGKLYTQEQVDNIVQTEVDKITSKLVKRVETLNAQLEKYQSESRKRVRVDNAITPDEHTRSTNNVPKAPFKNFHKARFDGFKLKSCVRKLDYNECDSDIANIPSFNIETKPLFVKTPIFGQDADISENQEYANETPSRSTSPSNECVYDRPCSLKDAVALLRDYYSKRFSDTTEKKDFSTSSDETTTVEANELEEVNNCDREVKTNIMVEDSKIAKVDNSVVIDTLISRVSSLEKKLNGMEKLTGKLIRKQSTQILSLKRDVRRVKRVKSHTKVVNTIVTDNTNDDDFYNIIEKICDINQ
jgi:hypothetical protein